MRLRFAIVFIGLLMGFRTNALLIGQDRGQHPFDLLAFDYLSKCESKSINCSVQLNLEGIAVFTPEAKGNSNLGKWQFNPEQGLRFDLPFLSGTHSQSIYGHGSHIAELWLPADEKAKGNGQLAQQGNLFTYRYWPMWIDWYKNTNVVLNPQEITINSSAKTLEIKMPGNPSIFVTFLESPNGLQITKLNSSVKNANFSINFERTFENTLVDGIWIPKSCIELTSGSNGDGKLQLSFSDISLDSNGRIDWHVEFPPGIKVNDHVNKQYYEVSKSNDPISSIESMANHPRRTDISKPSLLGVFSKPSNWQFSIVALVFATTCIVVLAIAIRKRIKS